MVGQGTQVGRRTVSTQGTVRWKGDTYSHPQLLTEEYLGQVVIIYDAIDYGVEIYLCCDEGSSSKRRDGRHRRYTPIHAESLPVIHAKIVD